MAHRRFAGPMLLAALSATLAGVPLGGCTTRARDIAYAPPGFRAPDPDPPAVDQPRRPMEVGDVVSIVVFELPAMSGDATVDAGGRLGVPLVGALPAQGRTIADFSAELTQLLALKYLQSPHVAVTLKAAAQKTVTVDGAVNDPGVIAITPDASLLQAIASAKGPSKAANLKRVVIFRQIKGVRQAAAFDLTTIRKGKDADPPIYPNDVIVVDGTSLPQAYSLLLQSVRLVSFAAFVF